MRLENLLQNLPVQQMIGSPEQTVSGLVCDSRQVAPGSAFFALPGTKADGFDYIDTALAAGATTIVTSKLPSIRSKQACYLQVANVRRTMALMASRYFGNPSADVPVIGVTGTNGKTTITYLLESVLRQAGLNPAVFGTVEYRLGSHRLDSTHTTPESLELQRMMADFRRLGADAFILEVSSHALEQHRVDGIEFDVAVFTNLTQDHLDYHQNLENYFASKRRLFADLLSQGRAAINQDDAYGRRLLAEGFQAVAFGAKGEAMVRPQRLDSGRDGIFGSFTTPQGEVAIRSQLIGQFNISNLLATAAAAQLLGIGRSAIEAGIASAPQVPGRLQRIENSRGVLALVDYAHTGDALEQVLKTLVKLEHRRLLALVGCGGDRDPGKRPIMGRIAVSYADLAIFTSDNPRSEDPQKILDQIRAGALDAGAAELQIERLTAAERGFIMVTDRGEAIRRACALAQPGDLLLVAGKGHEDYQILGSGKIHFDDREEVFKALQDLGSDPQGGGVADV